MHEKEARRTAPLYDLYNIKKVPRKISRHLFYICFNRFSD